MPNEAFRRAKNKKKAPIFPEMTGEKNNTIFTVRGREQNKYEIMVAF